MKSRILIDSCTLLSASVFVSSKDIDEETPLQHKFYEECRELFTFIQKNLSKRIGIITSTIENEAVGVLDRVIEGELQHRGYSRTEDFEIFSRVFNICDIKMRQLTLSLQREPVDSVDVAMKLLAVRNMYDEMEKKARTLPKVADAKASSIPPKLKSALNWWMLYARQDRMVHSQILNLIYNPVDDDDVMILSEAYHLSMIYTSTEGKGGNLYIASKDKHFVPVRSKRSIYEGREITDEIQRRFGIICEHPKRVKDLFIAEKSKR
jgi:hypothetical protein